MDGDQGQIDLRSYLKVLLRRKWILVSSIGLLLVFTLLFSFLSPKVFEASTAVLIDQRGREFAFSSPSGYIRRQSEINNQCEILRSESLAQRVIESLKSRSSSAGLSVLVGPDSVEALLKSISSKQVRDTDIISISARAPTADEAALIANTVADCFLEQSLLATKGEVSEVRNFLEEQLPIVETRLRESEESLRRFKEENALLSLTEETKGLTSKLSHFDRLSSETSAELATHEKRLSYLQGQLSEEKKGLVERVGEVTSPFVLSLREELVQMETDYSTYQLQGLSPEHPKMVDLEKRIKNTRAKLKEETRKLLSRSIGPADPLSLSQELSGKILSLEVDVDVLRAKKNAISKVIRQYSKRLSTLPEKEMELVRLQRDYEINESIFKMLRQRYEETKIVEAGKIAAVRVIDRARPPKFPIKPKKKRNLLFGLLVGVGLGIVGVTVAEQLDTSIKSVEEVESKLGLPVLGSIPMVSGDGYRVADSPRLVTSSSPHSPIAEAYRALRTNLKYTKLDESLKTILVTSAVPREGKSTVAANLAITTAQSGVKTLLVESDLRRPLVHAIFGVADEPGLTDLLVGRVAVEKVAAEMEVENLYIIPSGSLPPNPSELLGSSGMRSLVDRLRGEFDLIIFDSSPLATFTDAAVLGAELDGVALVVQLGRTKEDVLLRARHQLRNVQADILGVILNKVPVGGYGGYGGYYDSYGYGYYYRGYRQKPEVVREGEEAFAENERGGDVG